MFLEVCECLQFPQACTEVLWQTQKALSEDPAYVHVMEQAGSRFVNWQSGDPIEFLQPIADQTGVPVATVVAVCLINSIDQLRHVYAAQNVPEARMWDTLTDLTCKLRENHQVEGIWGTEAIAWYQRLFTLRIIKLGRLEYEPIGYRWDTSYQGIQKDDPVLNIHIPSCGSLPIEEVMDSLRQAHTFFRKDFSGNIPFVCASWMLYPPMCEQVFKVGSNLDQFYRCFQIVEQKAAPENNNFWRIFGIHYSPEALHKAPTDTQLRRSLLSFMQAGNCMGIGRGAFLFDGKNILHTK